MSSGDIYCTRCDRTFTHHNAWYQHRRDHKLHFMCWPCDKDFTSRRALEEHWRTSSKHGYCFACNTLIGQKVDLPSHFSSVHHYCILCNWVFPNAHSRHLHMMQEHDYGTSKFAPHELELGDIRDELAKSRHMTASPLDTLDAFFRNYIAPPPTGSAGTSPTTSSDYSFHSSPTSSHAHPHSHSHSRSSSCSHSHPYSPSHTSYNPAEEDNFDEPRRLNIYEGGFATYAWATNKSWNPYIHAFQCVLCKQGFKSLVHLNGHLTGPRHMASSYRCPGPACGKEFVTLSALCRHAERGGCGVLRTRMPQAAEPKSELWRLKEGLERHVADY